MFMYIKINSCNIAYYDLSWKKHLEYNNDINFDLSYIKVNNYVNPYSVMKPPGGFLDFLKITYLFIIY